MSAPLASAVYEGRVRHRRHAQSAAGVQHEFSYRMFQMFLDLDEIDRVCDLSPLWSARRCAPAAFRRTDFLPQRPGSLRAAALAVLAEQGVDTTAIGPIRLLAHLRYWGLSFNPLSLYYCYAGDGMTLRYLICEVHNTPWNERHCYVLRADGEQWHTAAAGKAFHVSPFMPMDMEYRFRFSTPDVHLGFHMDCLRGDARIFDATLSLDRRPLTPATLNAVLLHYPWMTAKVLAGIYFEALRLALKRVSFHPHPGSP